MAMHDTSSKALTSLLGKTLLQAETQVPTASIAGPGKVVALYFSAHWCPPCRGFTPQLAKIFNQFKASHERAADFSIVFVSSDRDEESFQDYYKDMPWHALPFSERSIKAKLSTKFGVSGIPTLILLDGDTGEVITANGREVVAEDPQCIDFPWKPRTLPDLLHGAELVNREGQTFKAEEALAGKVRLLYFSAHWCPPCRRFTPVLVKHYKALKAAGKPCEVVFVSSDEDEASFKEYLGEMPWLAVKFDDTKLRAHISAVVGVRAIPTLAVVDEEGRVVNSSARDAVDADPEGAQYPYTLTKQSKASPVVKAVGKLFGCFRPGQ